jgi:hypothetical protein
VDAGRLTELRRLLDAENLDAVARVVEAAVEDPASVDKRELAEAARWADRAARAGETADLRSAGRSVATLLRELEATSRRPRRRPRISPRRGALALAAVGIVAGLCAAGVVGAKATFAPALHASASVERSAVGAADLARLSFVVRGDPRRLVEQSWMLDGRDVKRRVRRSGNALVFRPGTLAEGDHELRITSGAGFLGVRSTRHFRFQVDVTPPRLTVRPLRTHRSQPVLVAGKVDPTARLSIAGAPADVAGGRFSLKLPFPGRGNVTLVAVDPAGNRTLTRVPVALVPRRPPAPVRGVHVTAYAWSYAPLRKGVLRLIAEHRINAVEIDLKDESGLIGFGPAIPLARRIGASRKVYDLETMIRQLHTRDVRVIGRLVCFRDPILAAAAWKQNRRAEVVQTPQGTPYAGYGGFTNFADETVRGYNIDVALAAAKVGIDEVLYDYVRRPDGPLSQMVFPGLHGSPERSIVAFLRESRLALEPYGTYLGASVFGVAANRPGDAAQNIGAMAGEVDYVAPMVYPSHWARGEYGVPSPNEQPREIVRRSLEDFQRQVDGSGARIVPWLQDFSLGVTYGPAEVRAQIAAAREAGAPEFLLWDPTVTYTAAALSRDALPQRVG